MLSIALVFAMGVVQAVHAHPENSTASHHVCSVCSTAHAGLSAQTVTATQLVLLAALEMPAAEQDGIFRPATTQFIRPPPSF